LNKEIELSEEGQIFKLLVGDEDGKIENADVPVRWCINKGMIKHIEDQGIKDPHILLTTTNVTNDREMCRVIAPISQLTSYVRFTKAGNMKIHAWIVDMDSEAYDIPFNIANNQKKKNKHIFGFFQQKKHGYYRTDLYLDDDEVYDDVDGLSDHIDMDIIIPSEAFGAEPPAWLKWFANLWHDDVRDPDQCLFRQRLLISTIGCKWIPVSLFVMGTTFLKLFIVTVIGSLGFTKGFNFKALLHPFDNNPHDMYEGGFKYNSFFIKVKREGWQERTIYSLIMLSPFALLLWGFISIGIANVSNNSLAMFWVGTFVYFVVSVILLAIDISSMLPLIKEHVKDNWLGRLGKAIYNVWHKIDMKIAGINMLYPYMLFGVALGGVGLIGWALSFIELKYIAVGVGVGAFLYAYMWLVEKYLFKYDNDYNNVQELLCPYSEMKIPEKRKPLKLKFLDFKNKVCKPMQY